VEFGEAAAGKVTAAAAAAAATAAIGEERRRGQRVTVTTNQGVRRGATKKEAAGRRVFGTSYRRASMARDGGVLHLVLLLAIPPHTFNDSFPRRTHAPPPCRRLWNNRGRMVPEALWVVGCLGEEGKWWCVQAGMHTGEWR
jgi:hypothetical protein